jgi:hypothetical protein
VVVFWLSIEILIYTSNTTEMNHLKTFLAGNNFFCFPKILLTSIKNLTENTTTMQLNHRQTQNTIPSAIETFTTNTKNKLKLHKFNITIRPLINNMKAPTYKIAKHVVRMLNKKTLHLTIITMLLILQT